MLAKLPILARRLAELPNQQLRAIFESLQLTVTYFHETHEAAVEIVLRDEGTTWSYDGQVNAVHPAIHDTNTNTLLKGPRVSV
ncbi:MAG: hypothetical protein ACRDJ4_08175 [Actinomycetota bacterium]